jgi:hypothetical protein
VSRKEEETRIVLDDGQAVIVKVLDGVIIDDLLVHGMKAEGFRVITGEDVFPTIDRRLRDSLIRIGVIQS